MIVAFRPTAVGFAFQFLRSSSLLPFAMASPSRTTLLAKMHRVLKKHYDAAKPDGERPILEAMLYACCLENASRGKADAAFSAIKRTFFDWNEMRVATVTELAEELSGLPDPAAAADRFRRILQHVFEARYSFDLEDLRKENLGAAVKKLEGVDGASPFVVAYAVQHCLGGHSIPVDRGLLDCLHVLGVVSDEEHHHGSAPGMERAIAKSKGVEFASLAHELGAAFLASPTSATLQKIFLEITPDAKENLKRHAKREADAVAKAAADSAVRKAAAKAEAAKLEHPKPEATKSPAGKSTSAKPEPAKPEAGKAAKKKEPAKGMAKRKPR